MCRSSRYSDLQMRLNPYAVFKGCKWRKPLPAIGCTISNTPCALGCDGQDRVQTASLQSRMIFLAIMRGPTPSVTLALGNCRKTTPSSAAARCSDSDHRKSLSLGLRVLRAIEQLNGQLGLK